MPTALGSATRVVWLAMLLWLAGCTTVINSITEDLAADLTSAILNSQDLETVRQGAPAYLLLIDALLGEEPRNEVLLSQAAELNGAYASAFVDDPERAKLLAAKALGMAERSVCLGLRNGCQLRNRPFQEYEQWLAALRPKDVPFAFGLATSWAGWLQANADDLAAVAELGRVKALVGRVLTLAPSYDLGTAQLYMGVLEMLLPPSVGGQPEVARGHFENAIAAAEGRNLMAKVFFAQEYGRGTFNRELHDRLLGDVLAADPVQPDMTLMNTLAQDRARLLLESADDYF
ncbi:MAG: TRAP transporter TatT component family protein [Pseudomonadales bacterium]